MPGVHTRVPFLTVWGDHHADDPLYGPIAREARAAVERLVAAGGDARLLDLPARGVRGNGHMLMLETNGDEIAALVEEWIAGHVPPCPARPVPTGTTQEDS